MKQISGIGGPINTLQRYNFCGFVPTSAALKEMDVEHEKAAVISFLDDLVSFLLEHLEREQGRNGSMRSSNINTSINRVKRVKTRL